MGSLRLFRLNSSFLNNDAVACYDCMIAALTSVHLQGLGLPASAAECRVKLNQNMKLFIQTNAGELSEHYQHSKEYIKGGEGQRKASSPPNWFFQSSILLNSLKEQCEGLYLTSVDKKYVSDWVAEGYVDNMDATTTDQCTQAMDTPTIITAKMQHIA
eukprot:4142029-Ditylum_brightwellii.AAC.1